MAVGITPTSVTGLSSWGRTRARTHTAVDIVIPVYNEEAQLRRSITTLHSFLSTSIPFAATITIADNASTDGTWSIAADLATAHPGIHAIRLAEKGRGRALRAAWSASRAAVVAYMDVDLSTSLDALVPLVAPLLSGHSDLAIGTRLGRGAHVVRGAKRELISRGYNLLVRSTLRSSCTDAQCGFKALRRDAALELLPLVRDNEWFFDTELLVTAQRIGLRIHEVPVHWVDDTDSRVDVMATALGDLRGVWRLVGPAARRPERPGPASVPTRAVQTTAHDSGTGPPVAAPLRPDAARSGRPRQEAAGSRAGGEVFADELWRFAGVGAPSTLVYMGLFAAFRPGLGSFSANAVAIALCSIGNTAVHRGLVGPAVHRLAGWRRWAAAACLLGVSLGFTSLALAVTRASALDSLVPELIALTVANLSAAVIRFGILRTWVFRPAFGSNLNADPPLPNDHDPYPMPPAGTNIKENAS